MSTTPVSQAPSSQAQVAYEAVRDKLIALQIPPGAPLSESALSEELGVGRTPLREAINRLADERLVVKFPRRGTFATDVQLADLPLLTELRVELEALAARQAAQRCDDHDRRRLLELVGRVGADPSPEAQMGVDVAIHRAIYRASHNPFLQETATRYHNLSIRIWYVFMDRLSGLRNHVAEHRALINLVLDRNADEAAEMARHHVENFARSVRDLL